MRSAATARPHATIVTRAGIAGGLSCGVCCVGCAADRSSRACVAGCDKKEPEAPDPGIRPGDVQVSPGDRLGWTQPAPDAADIASYQFALYLDGSRSTLAGVGCTQAASAITSIAAPCCPRLTAGTHTLELAAFIDDGGARSRARDRRRSRGRRRHGRSSFSSASISVVTVDQVRLNLVAGCRRAAASIGSRVCAGWIDLRRRAWRHVA